VAGVSQHLRSNINRSPTVGKCLSLSISNTFGKSKVNQFDVASVRDRDYNVFRLDISEYNMLAMEVFQSEQDLSAVE
jgi:hypothetical protein